MFLLDSVTHNKQHPKIVRTTTTTTTHIVQAATFEAVSEKFKILRFCDFEMVETILPHTKVETFKGVLKDKEIPGSKLGFTIAHDVVHELAPT